MVKLIGQDACIKSHCSILVHFQWIVDALMYLTISVKECCGPLYTGYQCELLLCSSSLNLGVVDVHREKN